MTWGISDYTNEHGESDGKFSMSLVFPSPDYAKPSTDEFLEKFKAFEEKILDDAVKNSEAWFGEEMSREVAKHTFFPTLKYPKEKGTKKIDYTKSPSIKVRVPCYNGKWNVEIYDTKNNMLFPCDNDNLTPVDFVPKQSNVACIIQCGGLWFGGKGWGVTWRLVQTMVKPHQVASVFGKCHISLSADDMETIEKQDLPSSSAVADDSSVSSEKVVDTTVEDSDEEEEEEETVEVPETPKKKVTTKKKAVVKEEAIEEEEEAPKKKRVVKKKA
tara:strand:- start:341 stop:1156 length:816 start_codon:yes stop_codon:yes gene_type:complete